MARKLPWDREEEPGSVFRPSPSSARQRDQGPDALPPARDETPRSPIPASRKRGRSPGRDPERSPSTSPVPEAPTERRMIPGPDADDRYRMVEDEFLHVANKFTGHLHRAEYNRLKAVAASRTAAAIRQIARPIIPGVEIRHAASMRQAKAERAVTARDVTMSRDATPTNPQTGLSGLMDSPRKEDRDLTSYAAAPVMTRAKAGFGSTARFREVSPSERPQRQTIAHARDRTPAGSSRRDGGVRSAPASAQRRSLGGGPTGDGTALGFEAGSPNMSTAGEMSRDLEDDDPFGLNQRRVRRQKSREKMKRTEPHPRREPSAPDTMPSFL